MIGFMPDASGLKSTFSTGTLYLEVSGAEDHHPSVIDVSTSFKSTTSGATTKASTEMVKNMLRTYIQNPRHLMLTVLPANVSIAPHMILQKAKDIDRRRTRTL